MKAELKPPTHHGADERSLLEKQAKSLPTESLSYQLSTSTKDKQYKVEKSKTMDNQTTSVPSYTRVLCFKTQMCHFYLNDRCSRGFDCTFAHTSEELNCTPNLFKTRLCNKWKHGQCYHNKSSCSYAHGLDDLRNVDGNKADIKNSVSDKQFKDQPNIKKQLKLQSSKLQSSKLQSSELQSSKLQSSNLQSSELQSSKLQSSKLQSSELQSSELQSSELQSSELQSLELQSLELQQPTLSCISFATTQSSCSRLTKSNSKLASPFLSHCVSNSTVLSSTTSTPIHRPYYGSNQLNTNCSQLNTNCSQLNANCSQLNKNCSRLNANCSQLNANCSNRFYKQQNFEPTMQENFKKTDIFSEQYTQATSDKSQFDFEMNKVQDSINIKTINNQQLLVNKNNCGCCKSPNNDLFNKKIERFTTVPCETKNSYAISEDTQQKTLIQYQYLPMTAQPCYLSLSNKTMDSKYKLSETQQQLPMMYVIPTRFISSNDDTFNENSILYSTVSCPSLQQSTTFPIDNITSQELIQAMPGYYED